MNTIRARSMGTVGSDSYISSTGVSRDGVFGAVGIDKFAANHGRGKGCARTNYCRRSSLADSTCVVL